MPGAVLHASPAASKEAVKFFVASAFQSAFSALLLDCGPIRRIRIGLFGLQPQQTLQLRSRSRVALVSVLVFIGSRLVYAEQSWQPTWHHGKCVGGWLGAVWQTQTRC